MKKITAIFLAIAVLFAFNALAARKKPLKEKDGKKWSPNSHPMIDAARKGAPREYAAARKSGATLLITPNERTFSVVWTPRGGGNKHDGPTIVVVGDAESWAFVDFDQWYPSALERGYGLIVVQWWVGGPNYVGDEELYADINNALTEIKADPKNGVLLYGSGRGATRAYALEYLDRQSATHWFTMAMAAGGAKTSNDILYDALTKKQLGATPFAGTKWITYCAIRDNQAGSGCTEMRTTADWLKGLGGTISLTLEDPTARENDFLRNPQYVYQVIDLFATGQGGGPNN